MASVTVQCCDLCKAPLAITDERQNPWGTKKSVQRAEGFLLTMGYSQGVGGWGRRQNAVNFSGVICGECFDAASEVYRAAERFLRDRGGRPLDPPSVWTSEPSPGGRESPVRRLLRKISG